MIERVSRLEQKVTCMDSRLGLVEQDLRALGKKMDAYKIMRRNFKPLGKQNSQLKSAISEERKTLKDLRVDIDNGSGSRDKYESYILFEKNKIKQLQILLDEHLRLKNETLHTYRELHDELNQLSLALLRKNNLSHP